MTTQHYALVDPCRRVVEAKTIEVYCGVNILSLLGKQHHIDCWTSAGYVVADYQSSRFFSLFVDDNGWLHNKPQFSFVNVNYEACLAGLGVILPLHEGDVTPNGTQRETDVAPITEQEVKDMSRRMLWLGHQENLASANKEAMRLVAAFGNYTSTRTM